MLKFFTEEVAGTAYGARDLRVLVDGFREDKRFDDVADEVVIECVEVPVFFGARVLSVVGVAGRDDGESCWGRVIR